MRLKVPARFSKEWWAWIGLVGLLCGTVSYAFCYATGRLSDTGLLWAALIGWAVGDLLMALGMEAIAPTKIVLRPGERVCADSPLSERGKVVVDFSTDGAGQVSVGGEIWDARCLTQGSHELTAGQEVVISGREGLTLLVDVIRDDT